MALVTSLERFTLYLESIEAESESAGSPKYLDLLSPGEALDLLTIRDKLAQTSLSPEDKRTLARLDGLLLKHYRLIADNVPPYLEKPCLHWWWYLHEGPHVREAATYSTPSPEPSLPTDGLRRRDRKGS